MTVYAPVGKISKKVGIPMMVFMVVMGIGIWFLPFDSFNGIPRWIQNGVCSFVFFVAFLMTLCWTLWGDYD